jgi:UPF0716 protein FxsA
MADVRDYIRFFDANNILKWFFLVMLAGLLFIGEAALLLAVAGRYGNWLSLAVFTIFPLFGLILVWPLVFHRLKTIRNSITWGNYPEKEIEQLLGLVASGFLMVLPGFFTGILGFVLYFFAFRRLVGKLLARLNHKRLMEAYEYLKLYDL